MLTRIAIAAGKSRALAALALVVWAPVAGELLTTSTPPALFFIPWIFALYAGLYGLGALLIREAFVRLRLSWPALLLLGAAYGVLEEGLCAKSFFDAHWRAIGPLGSHGRWMDVNWIWAACLTLFHAAYSVGLSIAAVALVFPRMRHAAWLGRFSGTGAAALFAFVTAIFLSKGNQTLALNPRQAGACVVLIVLLAAAALSLPRRSPEARPVSDARWGALAAAGFVSAFGFIGIIYFLPLAGGPAWLTAAALAGLFVFGVLVAWRATQGGARCFGRPQVFGVAAGVYGFFVLQAPLQEVNPSRADPASGMSVVALVLATGLFVLGRMVTRGAVEADRLPASGASAFF